MTGTVRVQPARVEVPADDPFKDDLLGRKDFAETLAATLGAIEGPGVFAIDGGWGTGKTTFVAMFSQHLRNERFRVVNINAWETDYADSPLAALVSKVAEAEPEPKSRQKLKNAGIEVLKAALPAAVKIATYGVLDINAATEGAIGDALAKAAGNSLARYEEHTRSMAGFKAKLRALAAKDRDRPLVVVVDELDRCRPTYAVDMLETIKHAFDVDGLLFVLAVNRRQLDQSAKTLYGEFVDPETYFRRFFDVELALPDADREGLVRTMLRARGHRPDDPAADLLAPFVAATGHGMRTMERTLNQYAMLHGLLDSRHRDAWWWIPPTVLVLRLADEEAYRAFVGNRMSDEELADRLFGAGRPLTSLRATSGGQLVEAALIAACDERSPRGGASRPSALRTKYRGVVTDRDGSQAGNHASEVIRRADQIDQAASLNGRFFWNVVERVERFEVVARQVR